MKFLSMKKIVIGALFFLINFSVPAQKMRTVKGTILRSQADVIKKLSEKIYSKYETRNVALATKADAIRHKIEICKNSLVAANTYPAYLKSLFSNYDRILKFAGNTKNEDSVAIALNFIEEDLSAKSANRYTANGEEPYYDTSPLDVQVQVVDAAGTILKGYEVKARPFFMFDAASIFNFHGLTNQAKEKVIPGWYVFIVKKGSFKKEKDFHILKTHSQPILLTIPVQD